MGRALSTDLRERVLKAWREGLSARRAAERFGVAASTPIRWVERAKRGETAPRKPGRKVASGLDAHEVFIVGLIEEQKDITLNEMVARLRDQRDVVISRSGLNVWLRKRGFTFKKRPHMHWSRTAPTSRSDGGTCSTANWTWILRNWSSLTRQACPPKWPAFEAAPYAETDAGPAFRMVTGRLRPLLAPYA